MFYYIQQYLLFHVCMYYAHSSLLKVVRQDHYSVEGYKFEMLKTEIRQNNFKVHSYDAVW